MTVDPLDERLMVNGVIWIAFLKQRCSSGQKLCAVDFDNWVLWVSMCCQFIQSKYVRLKRFLPSTRSYRLVIRMGDVWTRILGLPTSTHARRATCLSIAACLWLCRVESALQ